MNLSDKEEKLVSVLTEAAQIISELDDPLKPELLSAVYWDNENRWEMLKIFVNDADDADMRSPK